MPLGKDVGKNIRELKADNKKKGKARGAGGKPRSQKQVPSPTRLSERHSPSTASRHSPNGGE